MKRSWLRGHPIIWVDGKWVYEDNKADTPGNGGKLRPCMNCDKSFTFEQVDPCLGILEGVREACCGHGIKERSYIKFKNGVIIENFIVTHKKD